MPLKVRSKLNIVHIIPGTGDSFYCENCVRDGGLVTALRKLGHNVTMVPLYLPLTFDQDELVEDTPIFFGAISTYVKEKIPALSTLPNWATKVLDSRPMLKFAAHKADSTRAAGLEDMTLSMLRGKTGNHAQELNHLVKWIKDELNPDVIYIANLLLLGLAESLKETLKVPLICAMEDEDVWLEDMESEALKQIWGVIEENSKYIDAFVPVSDYYKKKINAFIKIPESKLRTVHVGVDLYGYQRQDKTRQEQCIGFLSRLSEPLGLGILIDAFLILKDKPEFSGLKLKLIGGETSDDAGFLSEVRRKLSATNTLADVEFMAHFHRESRIRFLNAISLLSVPMIKEEAFGVFLLEALAAGVPIVQPESGAFPEIIELTGGGVCYSPNTPEKLAVELEALLLDRDRLAELGETGYERVHANFSSEAMAKRMLEVYRDVVKT